MQEYQAGKTVTLFANFLTLEGKEAITVTDPKITIRHIDSNGTLITDVNEATMTYATETMYFYKWDILSTADIGQYTVEYAATVDSEYAEANETIQVVSAITTGCTLDYTTAAKVAEYLGVDASKISSIWIEWASRYIDLYTGQKFCSLTTTEKYDIEELGQDILFLDHYPITDVAVVKDDGTTVDSANYLVYNDEGMIKFVDDYILGIFQVGAFTKGRQKVEVTYTYGFTTVPKEIEWAATVITASIAFQSLAESGSITVGDIVEEHIGEYTRRRSQEDSSSNTFSSIEGSKNIGDRLEEDVLSVKNVLRILRVRGMRAV